MGLPERTGVVRGASVEERKGLAKGLDRKAGAEQARGGVVGNVMVEAGLKDSGLYSG